MGFFGGGSSVNLASPPAIGSTTPNTGAFTTLSASGSASIGTTADYQCLNIVQATSNPSNLPFISLTNHGPATIYAKGGYFTFNSQNSGIHIVGNTASVRLGTTEGAASDVVILRENATGVLAQRAGTNAQTFRLYNTFTDASNYERGFFRWSSNVLEIGAEAAGTGTQRQLRLPLGTVTVSTPLSITQTWNSSGVTFSGFVVNFTDTASSNSSLVFDFQKNGASLFKMDKFGNFTSGSWVFSSTNSTFGDWNAAYGWSSGSQLTHNSSNRNLRLVFGGSATMLEFGGATSSFPALKRSSAILQIRLADDTGYTTLDAQLRLQGTAPATAGATGTAGDVRYDSDYIYICTAANTWKRVAIATWP